MLKYIQQALNKLSIIENSKVFCATDNLNTQEIIDDSSKLKTEEFPYYKKPPTFETILQGVKLITKKFDNIKGFKFDLTSGLSNNFHITHSWVYPAATKKGQQLQLGQQTAAAGAQQSQQNCYYCMAPQYVGGNIRNMYDKPSVIMQGRWLSTGGLEAVIIKRITDLIQLKFQAVYPAGAGAVPGQLVQNQMYLDVDIDTADAHHQIKYGTGLFSFNMMQTIGKKLCAGFEFMYLSERKFYLFNYALKYQHKNSNYFFQYQAPNNSLTLAHQLNLKTNNPSSLVSEIDITTNTGQTLTTVGYKQKFGQSEVTTCINTKGKVNTILNLIYGQFYQLKLCATANFFKDTYKFGYGLAIGQVQ